MATLAACPISKRSTSEGRLGPARFFQLPPYPGLLHHTLPSGNWPRAGDAATLSRAVEQAVTRRRACPRCLRSCRSGS